MKIFQIGLIDEMNAWEEKRGVLLNKIVWYFLILGGLISISLGCISAVPWQMATYISALALSYIGLLVLSSKGNMWI